MGAPIHQAVKQRARELFEDEGYSPDEIVKQLKGERDNGQLKIPAPDNSPIYLPEHRSTINVWAKKEGWRPWREARKKVNQKIDRDVAAGVPFAISGINDPIWHLAILEAQRYVAALKPLFPFLAFLLHKGYSLQQIREAFLTNQPLDCSVDNDLDLDQTFLHGVHYDLGNSDQELTAATTAHVNQVLRPGPRVLLRLHPIIQYELKRVRELYRWIENFTPDGDNSPFPSDTFAEWSKNASELWEERLRDSGTQETQ